ncbi:MAG: hypothetical protein A3E36_00290 [Candidatus Andersenbacteria bacterium RIFCSPHIGHO2_12_FULL_45_11b]|uniref:Uncharacterized protein n=1 Tax=Candidatus Andersenbacteria bacterium RIFCSPHIGHO2_12_FULL_45_11b TaxID=1797282 RepID=A0A1G1X6L6_9BACT|nr:MAG: hypothetical protein A3E36_00290 [Candidatus Andersenbacteria bacterium RIFCSPHIGHO2_12_FULL_45_11b]
MSTATRKLSRQKALKAARRNPPATADERFQACAGFSRFGCLVRTHAQPIAAHLPDIAQWIFSNARNASTDAAFKQRFKRCEQAHPEWFAAVLEIRLHQPSRKIPAGICLFETQTGFSEIPYEPPEFISKYYRQARQEHSRRQFLYMEPLWVTKDGTRTPATPAQFQEMLKKHRETVLAMISALQRKQAWKERFRSIPGFAKSGAMTLLHIAIFLLGIHYVVVKLAKWKERRIVRAEGFATYRTSIHLKELTFEEAWVRLRTAPSPTDIRTLIKKMGSGYCIPRPRIARRFRRRSSSCARCALGLNILTQTNIPNCSRLLL